jgi:hypothetical protein
MNCSMSSWDTSTIIRIHLADGRSKSDENKVARKEGLKKASQLGDLNS